LLDGVPYVSDFSALPAFARAGRREVTFADRLSPGEEEEGEQGEEGGEERFDQGSEGSQDTASTDDDDDDDGADSRDRHGGLTLGRSEAVGSYREGAARERIATPRSTPPGGSRGSGGVSVSGSGSEAAQLRAAAENAMARARQQTRRLAQKAAAATPSRGVASLHPALHAMVNTPSDQDPFANLSDATRAFLARQYSEDADLSPGMRVAMALWASPPPSVTSTPTKAKAGNQDEGGRAEATQNLRI
jgi:hypothetical protein